MEQLEGQLPAADLVLDDALLDRIDEIVPPGANINPADGGLAEPGPGGVGAAAVGRRQLRSATRARLRTRTITTGP